MLKSLYVNNIALINKQNAEFSEKINVFSGETGAGKSIIIDALNFMLGAKADRSLIRHGEEKARVEGVFSLENREDVKQILSDFDILEEDDLLISRTLTYNGKNEIRANGRVITLSMLKEITHKLVDVHGQSEHFALSKISTHLELLDKYGKDKVEKEKVKFKEKYDNYLALKKELSSFGGSEGERERLLDLYGYQIEEIESAELEEGEEEELIARFAQITNVEKIAKNLSGAMLALSGEEGANIGLGVAKDCISYIDNLDKRLPDIKSRINSCLIEINDVADTLTEILDSLNFDDREADKIADRLERIKALKRKYGHTYQDIMRYLEKTKKEYEKLKNASERIADLLVEIDLAKQEVKKQGAVLTQVRKYVAQKFSEQITDELRNLGMENAQFDVMFKEGEFEELLSKNGLDEVEFMFSANLGEPLMPLIKVISGGEMSRFMLGLKSITAELDSISTLVFDEIDTGISGKIAHVVAEKFIKISKTKQLIIITHLPQIAATGDNNLLISKSAVDGHTETKIKSLNSEEKILELVRLSGAKEANDIAITSAKQLEEHYSNIKSITY